MRWEMFLLLFCVRICIVLGLFYPKIVVRTHQERHLNLSFLCGKIFNYIFKLFYIHRAVQAIYSFLYELCLLFKEFFHFIQIVGFINKKLLITFLYLLKTVGPIVTIRLIFLKLEMSSYFIISDQSSQSFTNFINHLKEPVQSLIFLVFLFTISLFSSPLISFFLICTTSSSF